MKTKQDFLGLAHATVLDESDDKITVKVPNRKEDLTVVIGKDVLDKLSQDDSVLQRMVKNLVSRNSKKITKETLNINKRNYRIFL
ncbi:hypothetical protein IV38_GL000566 [Lactobacillus selangorensis]|uniref:Uncharacterized protein n=1 Tax=Lactobacillus selangorensis TaxID=81857 RepID=A0A0R2FZW6_9LACO|nr:hypothetical protein [Lactobacillus selangorensis]KRN29679.1 hypothetical protein IV38_GL000566 [Lactobacillus selangorensis]KRN33792.1 hypothetical protein IV40_GL000102 [Lactobacillus selangorensis]